jgi:flagellar L-ring protein precursor FlgH
MTRVRWFGIVGLGLLGAAPAWAKDEPAPAGPPRASWITDQVFLAPGDVVTVWIDEQTTARERVTQTGSNRRSLTAEISADANGEEAIGATGVNSKWVHDSRQSGEANRTGDLYGVVSARVIAVDASGLAEIQGRKKVKIDGREQEITVHGFVRPEDLSADNVVASSRIAEAEVTYKGKNMGPKTGIVGKIVGMLWPF